MPVANGVRASLPRTLDAEIAVISREGGRPAKSDASDGQ